MTGFQITCLRCGTSMDVKPGFRDVSDELIQFGTLNRDFIKCRCGNHIKSNYAFALKGDVYIWVDASKNIPDESTVYGIDCPTGKCGM